MEKKEFTDEEIVKALEDMASECETNFSASVVDLIHRQKAEIERLANVNMKTIGKNAELLLQVDELTEQRDNQAYIAEELVQEKHRWTEQAVKDTAKKILGVILAKEFEKGDYLTDDELKRLFNERYGVEVE